jgi:hypothetical protein
MAFPTYPTGSFPGTDAMRTQIIEPIAVTVDSTPIAVSVDVTETIDVSIEVA